MKLSGNTILITGGGSGIGLAIAERFIKAGDTAIVCGRRETVFCRTPLDNMGRK